MCTPVLGRIYGRRMDAPLFTADIDRAVVALDEHRASLAPVLADLSVDLALRSSDRMRTISICWGGYGTGDGHDKHPSMPLALKPTAQNSVSWMLTA
jgi:hypothetical protein